MAQFCLLMWVLGLNRCCRCCSTQHFNHSTHFSLHTHTHTHTHTHSLTHSHSLSLSLSLKPRFAVFGFRSELLTCFCILCVCVCDFHCNISDCGVWYSLLSDCGAVRIGCVFFFLSCIRKNLGFCGVSVVVAASFWWLSWV